MTRLPELQRLARAYSVDPETALEQVLRLLCEQLDMTLAVVGSTLSGAHPIDIVVRAECGREHKRRIALPAAASLCAQVPDHAPLVIHDVAQRLELREVHAASRDVGCFAGVHLRSGEGATVGVLGLLGEDPHRRLDERDVAVLEGLGDVVADLYMALRSGPAAGGTQRGPTQQQGLENEMATARRPGLGGHLNGRVVLAEDLAGLTRPLLEALQELSGLNSTYLTYVDEGTDSQQLLLAHNSTLALQMPEGATIGWEQSMCWLALHEGTPFVSDLPARWPQAKVAAALGVVTHVSVPVRLANGSLWGTLCASDVAALPDAHGQVSTLRLFARLIAAEVERVALLAGQHARAAAAQQQAQTDELSGCGSRRTLRPWLVQALDEVGPGEVVALAFLDVDRFKAVNDQHGHSTGDMVLSTLGARLLAVARTADLVARLGGDEFVVGARLPYTAVDDFHHRVRDAGRFSIETQSGDLPVQCSTGVGTSDITKDAGALLALSDERMYRDKLSR